MTVRPSAGFLVAEPFLADHTWFDVKVDGRWIPADPFFLNTLHHWGVLDSDEWPLHVAPRNVLWRLSSTMTANALVRHAGGIAAISLSASWRTGGETTTPASGEPTESR
jgi:hypothetical protein